MVFLLLSIFFFSLKTVVESASYGGAECTKPGGYLCTDGCASLLKCVKLDNQTFASVKVQTCNTKDRYYCNATSADCSGKYCEDEALKERDFSCNTNGYFPDPYNCSIYHICSNDNHQLATCSNRTGFNVALNNCSLPSTSRACVDGPMPTCQSFGQIIVHPDNTSIFSVCAVSADGYLSHSFLWCDESLYFDNKQSQCFPRSGSSGLEASYPFFIFTLLISAFCCFSTNAFVLYTCL